MVLFASISLLMACETGMVKTDGLQDDSTGGFGRDDQRKGAGDVYVKMAVAYMEDGQIDVALQKARQALSVEPGNAQAHNVIALLFDRLGEDALAERHFNRGMEIQPRNSYLLNAFGTFMCNRQRYTEADELFQKALSNPLYKTPEVALTNAGICSGRIPDIERSETYLRRALEKNPRFAPALIQMGQVSFTAGKYLSARAYLQRYLEVAPHTAASLWLGVRTERELGDRDSEASYSLSLRNNFPDSNEAKLLMELQQK
ncbi:MAG: type IV pilus biogenesis/stability protein PilW [Sedimenticola sp.]|nr:MAG: type IV pilus biogenesis/stability protein PilW [Sedimenticola sp.]